MRAAFWVAGAVLAAGAGYVLRQLMQSASDQRELTGAMAALLARVPEHPAAYDPSMVAVLPEPAQRFFNFAIRPGTPLHTVADIRMAGELSLGTRDKPGSLQMHARQVIAAPHGFTWDVRAARGAMRIAGSDGLADDRSWTRFRLMGFLPVVRISDDPDHLRSAFGRLVAEAAFWTPAFLLPREGVVWSMVDRDTVTATITHGALVQGVQINVDPTGQPKWIALQRWSNANPDKVYRLQPFGGDVSDFREVSGFRVPFQVDGGNFFGTPDYFPFYKARVLELRFPSVSP